MEKTIRLLTQKDKETVLAYIERNHMETTFLIGNVLEFGLENDGVTRRCADYYGYYEDTNLKGILNFYNLGSSIPHFESPEALPYFVDIMKGREFEVLLGMANIIEPIYDKLKAYKETKDYSDDAYYINEDFTPFVLPDVQVVGTEELDFEKAVDFLIELRTVGFGDTVQREEIVKLLAEKVPEEDRVFVVKEDEIVAHAVIQATTSKINQIGAVYTSTKHRGKGYCKAAVSKLCDNITARGKVPTLMVRKDNTPAVKAYQALGFRHYKDYLIISF